MRARPEDLRPPCFQSSRSRPRPPSRGNTPSTRSPAAPKTRVLEGHLHLNKDRGRSAEQNEASIAGRSSAAAAAVVVVVVPSLPLPATPTPPTNSPTPPDQNALHLNSGRREECEPNTAPASPSSRSRPLAPEEEEESREREEESVPEQDWELQLGPAGSERSPPATPLSHGSLSDLSRPPSSLFSRSTHLTSGRSSVLSAFSGDSDPEGSGCFSPPRPSPAMRLPLTTPPPPPPASNPPRSSMSTTTNSTDPPLYEPLFGQAKPHHAYRSTSRLRPNSVEPLSHRESAKTPESLQRRDACVDPGLDPSLDSSRGLGTLAFPSTTWSSCPSPQMTTPCSGSGAELTPSPPLSRLESRRWSVLPPISPVRGRCGSEVSRYSELSCSGSRVFDELDAIAPRSTSGASLDLASDSSGCTSPGTELSPGLAALTMGCDSGNLGSLSRVQLLLLGRPEPECLPSPCGLEEEEEEELEQDWSAFRMRYDPGLTSEGVLRPLTAGGVSERCDSAGKVQGNKSDQSEGGSGSPSSWIIDPSPSYGMFRPSRSPCPSNHSCGPDEGGPPEKESNYPGWRDPVGSPAGGRSPESLEHRNEDKERRIMEERRNKVLNVLSRLQEDTPRQGESSKGCCNFEDFDFLAKYCIFSQEKLDEYKRAFEAEDSDGDGYISCVQVLLALKNIIPPELLSDEEEIYVCRILEMVDFRVTDGLVDLRLFSVIASLAQKIASMDDFMRSLISSMDFRSLEVRLFKAKRLFLFLLEERRGDAGSRQGFIGAEQLLLELKAGGIRLEQEAAVRLQLQRFPPLDLLGFLAYLPLFMLVHKSIIANPLDDSGHH